MKRPVAVVNAGERNIGYRFALPWIIGFLALLLLPALASLALSFMNWDGLTIGNNMTWVGPANYQRVLNNNSPGYDSLARTALLNSLIYTCMAVPAGLAFSLLVAMLLNQQFRGRGLIRTLVFLPSLMGGVATIVIWSWLFNPRFGPINATLLNLFEWLDPLVRLFRENGTSDWSPPNWFYSPAACKPALALMHVWLSGGAMLVFLAALQRVPPALIDAARLDGAGKWHQFRHVTLPHISPALLFNLIIGVIFAMQTFDEAYLLYNRSQNDGLLFYMLHLYRTAFEPPYDLGYASALAWLLLMVIALLVAPIFFIARRFVYEASRQ